MTTPIDEAKVMAFAGQVVADGAATYSSMLGYVGDKLGLYRAMATSGPITADGLAAGTGTNPRMIAEWLLNQAAGGYVDYDPAGGRYTLPAEHAAVLAVEDSPVFMAGAFEVIVAVYQRVDRILEAFRTGKGLGWGDHHPELFSGVARFFETGYRAHLVADWVPAVGGLQEKLAAGAQVADVGCGFGISTVLLAEAFPHARLHGFDRHTPSIEQARKRAAEDGVADRATFAVADSTTFPGTDYDVIGFFDALHDMADPAGTVRRARATLADDGVVMVVEPFAGDRPEDNFHPVGRMYSAASTLVCTPCSLDDDGAALGALAGETRLRPLFEDAGFGTFERALETPFNIVYAARA